MLRRLKRYERISIENRRFCSNRVSLGLNFRHEGSPSPTILLVKKTMNDLLFGIRMMIMHFVTLPLIVRFSFFLHLCVRVSLVRLT